MRVRWFAVLIALAFAAPSFAATTTPPLVIADLDGDHKLDVAVGSRSGNSTAGFFYRIDIGLSGSARSTSFTIFDQAATGLNVATMDLDGDNDLDFVITGFPLRGPIGIWINDGTGKFERSETSHYSSSIWTDRQDLQSLPVKNEQNFTEAGVRRHWFQLVVCARAQIPGPLRTHYISEVLAAPSVSPAFCYSLRAPPAIA